MKIAELFESTDERNSVELDLKAAGYRKIGDGVDSTVWSKNKSEIVKVVAPTNPNDLKTSTKMAKDFFKFCKQMNSIHLPVFTKFVNSPVEEVIINRKKSVLISMERLDKLNKTNIYLYYQMSNELDKTWLEFVKFLESLGNAKDKEDKGAFETWSKMKDDSVKVSKAKEFFDVMKKTYLKGESLGYLWDLHTDNMMMRGDVPVIVDPWVL